MLLAAAARGGDGGSVDVGGGKGGILLKDFIPVLGALFAVNVLLNDIYWALHDRIVPVIFLQIVQSVFTVRYNRSCLAFST